MWLHPVPDPAAMRPLAALGMLTAFAAGVALATASPQPLLALVMLTVGLWVLAMVRHTSARR